MNPTNANRFFATGSKFAGGADKMALFKTDNGGSSWTASIVDSSPGSLGRAVAVNPLNDQVIYVGGDRDSGSQILFYVSTNGGSSWTQLAAGLFAAYEYIRVIAVDPAQPMRVFVGTSRGLYRSENSGGSWTKTGTFGVSGIRINRYATNEIWASSNLSGMYFSNNSGSTWTAVNDGLETLNVNGMDWSSSAGVLYAATSSGGIYKASSLGHLTLSATAGGTTNPAPGNYIYPFGTVVNITAIPQTHFRFLGWTGDATGTANPLILTMTTDKSVMANFQRIIYAPSFTGEKIVNRGVVVSEFINILKWQAHADNIDIIKYRLYLQSGTTLQLLASFDPGTFEYHHRGLTKDGAYTYVLKAVNNEPREGDPATISVR